MKRILIINKAQYGEHIDSYKYCKYLNKYYEVNYIGFDFGFPKIEDETNVIYIKRKKNKVYGMINFIREIIKEVNSNNYDVTFLVYFSLCSLISIFSTINFLDIRTGKISKNIFIVRAYNILLLFESRFFKKITIISESLRKHLLIPKNKSSILPLGSDIEICKNKKYSEVKLFYIGTLSHRNIHHTIEGLDMYIRDGGDQRITYDIFGDGREEDVNKLKDSIEKFLSLIHI